METSEQVVLLGAGASADAGVPTAKRMTARMSDVLQSDELERALAVIVGGLQMGAGWQHNISTGDPDIERVIDAARMLSNRFDAELAPFVGNWHPVLDELERSSFGRGLEANFRSIVPPMPTMHMTASQADDFVRKVIREIEGRFKLVFKTMHKRPDGQLFQRLLRELTENLVRFAWITTQKDTDYLRPLVSASAALNFPIVTLNYDNAIELCSSGLGLECETGLEQWNSTGSLLETVPTTGKVPLIKLHGSIDWRWDINRSGGAIVQYDSGHMDMVIQHGNTMRDVLGRGEQLAIVFGGKNKLTPDGPFLDLFSWYRKALRSAKRLVVIGYSFRDAHVNSAIRNWRQQSADNQLIIVTDPSGDLERKQTFLQMGMARPSVEVLSTGAINGIEKLFA